VFIIALRLVGWEVSSGWGDAPRPRFRPPRLRRDDDAFLRSRVIERKVAYATGSRLPALLLTDVHRTALAQIRANLLRSIFTLLGIIVSVAFLVAVVAVIQGMNAYVSENIANAMVGSNAFQVRRTPINVGLVEDEEIRKISRRPRITDRDAASVAAALPEAQAVAVQSGWPTPRTDVVWNGRTVSDVLIFGVTPGYQVVQDYRFTSGRALGDIDVSGHRAVAVIGADIAKNLFESVNPVGREIRIRGHRFEVVGVVAPKGRMLGQSFDGFVILPLTVYETIFGKRQTTTISVKMSSAAEVAAGMRRAEEAMRLSHRLRPGVANDFTVETADALIAFWKQLTSVLFAVVPVIVAIGVVVGGIVIMNIMMMSVNERTHEIGLRKAVGATRADIRRQFLTEAVMLASLGGAIGTSSGWLFALVIATASPLPARVTTWSVLAALTLGTSVGIIFGVYPATRAARLDPVTAMRAE
jgi:putative ABC transport system permease protein